MQEVFGDLHIHIGTAQGRPVKITASRQLTLQSLIFEDAPRKGMDIIGIVDTGSILVSAELEQMLKSGTLEEHPQGGFIAPNGILVIAGCEVECREGMHLISYFPTLDRLKEWQKYMSSRVSNLTLSTQKANAGIVDILNLTLDNEGLFCPAHAFTPHKGMYGMWTDSLADKIGGYIQNVKAIELGLSCDTEMADTIAETSGFTFLSNSDAHSAGNIGREYNLFEVKDRSFQDIAWCIEGINDCRVAANYGMDPRLGKYHRTYCLECGVIAGSEHPVMQCEACGSTNVVKGVYDRILQIRDYEQPRHPEGRPPYNYRVPLKDIPGLGPATIKKLNLCAENEIDLVEKTPIKRIEEVAGAGIAGIIASMRSERLKIIPGGGGKYGKVLKNNSNY